MRFSTRQIAFAGVLGAITVALGLMPIGGFILVPGISVTTMHIPTILAGIFEGPVIAFGPRILIGVVSYYVFALVRGKRGEVVLTAGATLLLGYTGHAAFPKASPPARWAAAVVLAAVGFLAVQMIQKRYGHGPALAAVAGTLTNTIGVLGLCVGFGYIPVQVAAAVGVTNGIPEAAVAMILTSLIYRGVRGLLRTGGGR